MVDHSSRKVHFPLTRAQIVRTACLFREVVVEVEAEEPHNCVRVRHTCHWHTQSKARRKRKKKAQEARSKKKAAGAGNSDFRG